MWIDKTYKKLKLFFIDDLEKKLEEYILSKYGLKASYSSNSSIIIFLNNYSDIELSIINNKILKITLTTYNKIKELNAEISYSSIKSKWTIEHHDNYHNYEDVIDSLEDLINLDV